MPGLGLCLTGILWGVQQTVLVNTQEYHKPVSQDQQAFKSGWRLCLVQLQCKASDLPCVGIFWFNCGRTDTIAGARNINGLVFHVLGFLSVRVRCQTGVLFSISEHDAAVFLANNDHAHTNADPLFRPNFQRVKADLEYTKRS